MKTAFIHKWKVYLMEAICLSLFMVSASVFGTLLEHPGSFIRQGIKDDVLRRWLMGLAMGLTATGIIYSPMGKLSGAHMNPAVSVSFSVLGKLKPTDTIYYITFQLIGGLAGMYLMTLLLRDYISDSHVNYVVTQPAQTIWSAFFVEIVIAFGMMIMVLITTNNKTLAPWTGVFAGILVTIYVINAGPVSGFGMNPARTLASALPAMQYKALWIYMTAPFIGMLGAVYTFLRFNGVATCGKLYHVHSYRCIFNCDYCVHTPEADQQVDGNGNYENE